MDPTTSTENELEIETNELTTAEIFDVLASDRRRYVLHCLDQRAGGVALDELAEQIAIWEDDPTAEHRERVLTTLIHLHLPKLVGSGLLSYERAADTVTRTAAADRLRPYLELARPEDVR